MLYVVFFRLIYVITVINKVYFPIWVKSYSLPLLFANQAAAFEYSNCITVNGQQTISIV